MSQSVQSLSCVQLFQTPWAAALQASLSSTISCSLSKLMSIESVMPSKHLILCPPLLLPPSIFPSITVFSNESVLHISWPKYWSFSFSISPSNECSGLISFRMNWLNLLAVQGTVQHHSSKASILLHSAFFIVLVQFSHPYMTNWKNSHIHSESPTLTSMHDHWKNHCFDQTDLCCKVVPLLFNMLSRLVITVLPRSKCLLISWLQSPSAMIFGAQENKVCHCFHYFPLYLP